jgi:hypothetical protein
MRVRVGYEEPEHPFSRRASSDPLLFVWFETDGDELGEGRSGVIEHTECGVASPRHETSLVDDVAQQRRQLEIPLNQEGGFEQPAELGGILDRVIGHKTAGYPSRGTPGSENVTNKSLRGVSLGELPRWHQIGRMSQ